MLAFVFLLTILSTLVNALDNGLALTPTMGWRNWERFRCEVDCKTYPNDCIGERLFMDMADAMVAGGFKDAGYDYVLLDDCWPAPHRDSSGRLQADPKRFPHGIKALADYIHSKGLKFGIYEDFGTKTCAGYIGSEFYMQTDAQTFADWGADLVFFDHCYAAAKDMKYGFPIMEFFLNKTGRPIIFTCPWPMDNRIQHIKPDFPAIRKTCNMWRIYNDIEDSWDSVIGIINWWSKDWYNMSAYHGPGGWNNPDMIVVGNFGLSPDQEKVHFGMWCIFAAPLLLANDLRSINNRSKALLLNKRLLAINQDPLGIQGKPIQMGDVQVWTKPILPKGSKAVAVVYTVQGGNFIRVKYPLEFYGLDAGDYHLTEVFEGHDLGQHNKSSIISFTVNPTGIYMFTAKPVN
ncbi:alpha-galactosidase A-like isoform X2 [Mytilus galloprovincialis]